MGTCCSVPSVEEAESAQQFRALGPSKNNLACREEMAQYVASRAELWAMLSVNLGLSEEECKETATRVAMELASCKQGPAAQAAELTALAQIERIMIQSAASFNHAVTARHYIDYYEKMLARPLINADS